MWAVHVVWGQFLNENVDWFFKKKKKAHTENLTILEAGGGWQEAHESSAPVGFHMADTPIE
jgi:hypothetical protein